MSSYIGYAQEFEVEILSDTILTGIADPEEPIIFYFDANNLGEETFLVDMIREETDVPDGWEISLCTEACFPPEVTEAVFFLDEMATDEVSVYFYASSEGSGMTSIRFTNREDSSNTFQYDLYVDTEPLSYLEIEVEASDLEVFYNPTNRVIELTRNSAKRGDFAVYNAIGNIMYQNTIYHNTTKVDASAWTNGIYYLKVEGADAIKLVVN